MTFNYYLHTDDEKIRNKLLDARQINNDFDSIKEILDEKDIKTPENNVVAVSLALLDAGFKVKHYKKYFKGDIGIAQAGYQIMQEDYGK